jgi:hypothetical protein
MVIMDWAVNDPFIHPDPSFAKGASTFEGAGQLSEEIFMRRVLRLRQPDAVSVIVLGSEFLSIKYTGDGSIGSEQKWKNYGVSPFVSAQPYMEPICKYYGVPIVSFGDMFLKQYFMGYEEFNLGALQADRCCHPRPGGHRAIALVLIYTLIQELRWGESHPLEWPDHDTTINSSLFLPEPWLLSAAEVIIIIIIININIIIIIFIIIIIG